MPDLLFVYGTLHPDHAPAEIAQAARQLELVGEASIRARKFQFKLYPAIRLDDNAGAVHGHLFRVPESLWPTLDAYEGYEAKRPDLSLFVRKRVNVRLDGKQLAEAWVYEYARPLPAAENGSC